MGLLIKAFSEAKMQSSNLPQIRPKSAPKLKKMPQIQFGADFGAFSIVWGGFYCKMGIFTAIWGI